MPHHQDHLTSCPCCGLIQQVPELIYKRQRIRCCRCGTVLKIKTLPEKQYWVASLSAAALLFYLPAILLPIMSVEQLGHRHENSLWTGVLSLLENGNWFIAIVIFIFSMVLPLLKLSTLFMLSLNSFMMQHHHKASMYHIVELLGRWGMLDVMLVAILVAFIKMGDLVTIHIGVGLIAFSMMVLLSLIASMLFNPQQMWQSKLN
ncbi:paraquat-inducible protein A [Thioflexithrix psekupsensis]|uniref:Paraquat-inducible membrane protein A n=1 Tax=Thioflexithrix psekupsensis TaxID=1570016 RepID=A0A251XA13_9GAMM|nr:paraquat-inducible protein A [Thioflexithrix psekupsensis]OUD15272.1 hypothetical protein TPSD3_01715 [Thioflexithrix psekupsensis]